MHRKILSSIAIILTLMLIASTLLCGCGETGSKDTTNADNTALAKNEDKEYPADVTFSAPISEVDGIIYAARKATSTSIDAFEVAKRNKVGDIPTCKTVPIETDDFEVVAGFCEYDGYVYYVVGRAGTDFENYSSSRLYRCKTDWTGNELIADNGPRDFVIDHGVLYFGTSAFELPDLKNVDKEYPQYVFDGIPTDECYIQIFDDIIFFDDYSDYTNRKIYSYDGRTTTLIAENATLDGGYACGYLYYSRMTEEGTGKNGAILYRYNMQTGEEETVHKLDFVSGGDGPYFCW